MTTTVREITMNQPQPATIFIVDWDGTCTEDAWPDQGPWIPEAIPSLFALLQRGRVRIFSARLNPYVYGNEDVSRDPLEVIEATAAIRAMLDEAGLVDVEIHTTAGKPTGHYYIDNLAVEFNGDWNEVLRKCGVSQGAVRLFRTGATRNTDVAKHDYDGFLSPITLRAFGRYMHEHRVQKDGTIRDSDNWQKGIPLEVYMKSGWRHFFDLWELHRGGAPINPDTGAPVTFEEALMGLFFNVQGYAHEYIKGSQ